MTKSSKSDIKSATDEMNILKKATDSFGSSLTSAFASGIAHGKSFDDILKSVSTKFLEISLKAGLKPLDTLFSSGVNSLTSSAQSGLSGFNFSSIFGGSSGASTPMNIMPFAEGGVVSSPSYFPMGSSLGVAGERGSEAIMPLRRGSDGRLGVASSGGGSSNTITVNISATDVDSFRRSESQVSAALARAVARGNRGL